MDRKTLFITGASSGIGAATARAAVKAGWNVGLFARSQQKLEKLTAELGPQSVVLIGDATDADSQMQALEALNEHFGGIDAVFANAGRGVDQMGFDGGDLEEWRGMVDLNIMGLIYTCKLAMPYLKERKGQVILTGSAAGRLHLSGSVYGATKWFVHGLGGNLAEEMRDWGGRCSVIAPGMVDTDFFDDGAPEKLKAEDVADAVLHALSAPDRAAVREVFLMPQN